MRAKEKTNTSPYGIHLFCVLFYALSLSCFHLHGVASIRLHYIVHGRHLINTQAFAICALACFFLTLFLSLSLDVFHALILNFVFLTLFYCRIFS